MLIIVTHVAMTSRASFIKRTEDLLQYTTMHCATVPNQAIRYMQLI